jgi:hypothetical protein
MSELAIMQQLPSQFNLLQTAGHPYAISNPRLHAVELPKLRELGEPDLHNQCTLVV